MLRDETTGAAKQNKLCKSVFAFSDYVLKSHPNISILGTEAAVMYSFNRTSEWLENKAVEEQETLLNKAVSNVKLVRAQFKQGVLMLKGEKAQQVKRKLEETECKELRSVEQKIQNTNNIIYWGLCQSKEQIDAMVKDTGNEKEIREGLKAQLHFRKNVLQQNISDKKAVINFTTHLLTIVSRPLVGQVVFHFCWSYWPVEIFGDKIGGNFMKYSTIKKTFVSDSHVYQHPVAVLSAASSLS